MSKYKAAFKSLEAQKDSSISKLMDESGQAPPSWWYGHLQNRQQKFSNSGARESKWLSAACKDTCNEEPVIIWTFCNQQQKSKQTNKYNSQAYQGSYFNII